MASNEPQINGLLDKLYTRTVAGSVKWERSVEPRRYQARVGDFVIQLGDEGFGIAGMENITLMVRRLTGSVVEVLGSNNNALSLQRTTTLTASQKAKLQELYEVVAGGNEDLDELLKILS